MTSVDELWARLKTVAEELAVSTPGLTYTQAENIVLQVSRSSPDPIPEDARAYLTMQLLNLVAEYRRAHASAEPQPSP